MSATEPLEPLYTTWSNISIPIFWIARFSTTAVEAFLMAFKLCEELNRERRLSNKGIWTAILEIRRLTPVLYIFYRDGALSSIPIFVVNFLGMLAALFPSSTLNSIDWNPWLLVTFQICGSRLFLNIRRANEKLTTSMVLQYLSTLRFTASQNNMNNPGVNRTMHYCHDSTS